MKENFWESVWLGEGERKIMVEFGYVFFLVLLKSFL